MVTETDRNKARSAVVSAYQALDCVTIPFSFLHAFADAAVDAVSTGAEPVKTAPAVAVKTVSLDDLLTEVIGDVVTFRDMGPEEDETWESWYYAAFDMLTERIREKFKRGAPALSAQVQDVARCLDCDGYNCDDGCAYPDPAPVAQVQDVAIPVAWQFRCETFPEWQTTDRKPGDQLQMEYETGVNMKGLEVRPLYAGFSANTLDLEGWKEIPPETVVEEATKGKQVLAYENGRYYNAWLEFEASEGGWLWYDDADSEPNPSHWMSLPASPAPKHGEEG